MEIRNFKEKDAIRLAELAGTELLEEAGAIWSEKEAGDLVKSHDDKWVLEIASKANVYVAVENGVMIGWGAISDAWKEEEKSVVLLNFAVGFCKAEIKKYIIRAMEKDFLFHSAKKIEIPINMISNAFYRNIGCTGKRKEKPYGCSSRRLRQGA